MSGIARVVPLVMSVVMLMLALAPLCRLKGFLLSKGRCKRAFFQQLVLCRTSSDGLLVILAYVRQQGLYPPVEAVPPKPSSLLLLK